MNIDDLTIGEAKQLASLLGAQTPCKEDPYARYIGKYAIVRSRNEGINFGRVVSANVEAVILADARRLWFHRPNDKSVSWYEGVANTGLASDSRISSPVAEKLIAEDYSITLCTEEAVENIKAAKSHPQQ